MDKYFFIKVYKYMSILLHFIQLINLLFLTKDDLN